MSWILGVRDSISLGQKLKECLSVATRAQKKRLLANQQQESVQIATDVVSGEALRVKRTGKVTMQSLVEL